MTDLSRTEPTRNSVIKPSSFMDALIDGLAHDIYLRKSLYVGVNDLPFWIQRFMAKHKKQTGKAPVSWTMGEPTTCEMEDYIETYFKNRFPNAEVIGMESNAETAKEMNEAFSEHGEYIHSKLA